MPSSRCVQTALPWNGIYTSEKSGVHTKFVPDYNDIIPTKPYTEDLLGLPVVNIRHVPLTNTFHMICKRVVDIIGSVLAIIVFSPVMLVTAFLVKTTSKGPLLAIFQVLQCAFLIFHVF